ncbi:PAS domain-containing sensor histidine kinase [Hymenobacter sp. GOD-10R]|uniref:PAS domain-containing sensor histidine kinase n=1 Tax=Hymenobacter sp. GOD-10R TaxID=3093922 RepID=UPI002D775DE4|nr:PAS domain-containing protein [Hymenobacter sp. GOD-10R]WRQ27095.1 PAS domain-containing protein [Hymenobacter sp. GOD-10R]
MSRSLDLLPVFNAQPGATLLLSPEWVIVGASDDYLAATLTERDLLVGQHIFDAFPDNPETPEANAVVNVRASLERVLATKQPHEMAPQHYDVPDPTWPGRFVERYWQSRHTPVLDAAGQVQFIIQSVLDITASRQVERQLRESVAAEQAAHAVAEQQRQRFREVLTQMPAYIAVYQGPDHIYQFVNPAYQSLFPHRSFLGRPFREGTPESVELGVVALFDQVYQSGEPVYLREMEGWFDFHGNGQPVQVFLNISLHPLRNVQGHIDGVMDFTYDVSQQVRARQQVEQFNAELEARVQERTQVAEQALATAERERTLLQLILDQSPVAIGVFQGEELRITAANAQMATLWGRTPEQVIGLPFMDAVPELRGQGFDEQMRQVLRTEVPFIGTETPADVLRGEHVQTHYYNFVYQPLYDADGQLLGAIDVAVEVTEQVLARQQADEAAAELRLLTAHSPAFLFRTDAAGSLVYLNKEFFEWTGLDAARLRSLDEGWATVHPGDLVEQQPSFVAAVQAGQPWLSTPYRFRRADGQYRWMLSRSQPLFGTEGQVLGHSGLTFEVHEQVALQQQLTRTNVDLDNFIYTASHDLKAPITNLEGLLLALEHELPEAGRTGDVPLMLTLMQDAIERFRRTITHLTDLSRLQKEHNPASDAVAVAPVVEAVRLDLTPLLVETQGQLTVTIPEDLTVRFAEKNLRSVVYNLLSNAFKYRHLDRVPAVQLRSWRATDYVVLEVQDNGLGLDLAQDKERLFAMFQRLHTHVEGTGVGLYMVKRILENAGGRIEVDSQLGQGSTFRVYFPR